MFFYYIFWTYFFFYVWSFWLDTWLCTACVPVAKRGQNSALDPLKMELATVCAGN